MLEELEGLEKPAGCTCELLGVAGGLDTTIVLEVVLIGDDVNGKTIGIEGDDEEVVVLIEETEEEVAVVEAKGKESSSNITCLEIYTLPVAVRHL